VTSPATNLRCTACGAELRRAPLHDPASGGVSHVYYHDEICPGFTLELFRDSRAAISFSTAGVTIAIARDDRAGVTLPIAVQPVGGDQLEATPRLRRSVERRLIDLEAAVREELGAAGARVVEMERAKP